MKQVLLLCTFVYMNVHAHNLQNILDSLQTSAKVKSYESTRDAQIAQNSLISDYEAPVLGMNVAHAKDSVEDGVEYGIGISQEINNPFSNTDKNSAKSNLDLALKQETKHSIHILELDVTSKYYGACISKESQEQTKTLVTEQTRRYSQVESAYELGEISRKDLLFNKLDLASLNQKLSKAKRDYLEDFARLQNSIDNLKIESLECDDLIAPKRTIVVKNIQEHSKLKTINYKKNASNSFYEMHDSLFPKIGYELVYEKELDTRRYTAGVSIPLGGLSSKQESLKTQELKMASAYAQEEVVLKSELQNDIARLKVQLEVLFDELHILQNEILPLNKELLSLSKLALKEGEGSIMEYIDSSRSYSENVLEMLALKRTYYLRLFELYKTADKEYGEK